MVSPSPKPAIGERTQALKAVPFFTQMNDQELDVIRSVAVEKSYPKHAVVLTEGEIGDSLYMIESGRVKVFIGDEEGREIILKLIGPGHFFGEMAMIDHQPRSASVTTLEVTDGTIRFAGYAEPNRDLLPVKKGRGFVAGA